MLLLCFANIQHVSKNCIVVSVRTFVSNFMNFSKFWYVDGKVAEIACCIFHPTWRGNLTQFWHKHKCTIFFETRYICTVYTVSPKVYCLMFDNNFGKCAPIIKILLSSDSWENSLCAHTKTSTSAVKFENPKMLLIFTASSTNCWHVPDDTLRTSFNIWQYLDRLSQDCSQWVTDYHFEVCQTTSQINS